MKRTLFPMIIILSMILSISGPIPPVQANSQVRLPDLDQDGISSTLEYAGWYNLAGGPYRTNPDKADSDQDGLTDAQEKLFNTDPLDPQVPGIAVLYDSAYKTFEYYNTTDPAYLAAVQGGSQYLLTEALVVRRGTTLKIAAVNSGAWTLTISGAGLTALTPVRDPARGGWKVTVPAGGTVGPYTATITNGAWSKSMGIYVIFELPTDLTPAEVAAYLYDDDPANKRDEVSVWWRARDWKYYYRTEPPYEDEDLPTTECLPSDPMCSDWQYHTVTGYAQAFWTEQFTKKVLVDFTLPVMKGKTTPYTAAQAIIVKADQSVRVNFESVKNSFSGATDYYFSTDPAHQNAPYRMDGGACETSAGVLTSMLRSAGIPSRAFALDYNKTSGHGEGANTGAYEYDHAVMMWMKDVGDDNNLWYADRSFRAGEDEWQSEPVWESGSTGLRPLAEVGIYNPNHTSLQFNNFQDYYSDLIQSANADWDFQDGSFGGGMVNTEWTGIDVHPDEFVNYVENRDFKWNSIKPLQIQQSPYVDIFNCQLWMADNWAPGEWRDPIVSLPEGRDERRTYYLPVGIPTSDTDIENWPYNPFPTSCTYSTSPEACAAFQTAWDPVCTALPGQTFSSVPLSEIQQIQPTVSALNTSIQLGNILNDASLDQNGDGRFDQLVVEFELTSSQAGEVQLGGWLRAGDKQIRADTSRVMLTAGLQTLQITFDGQKIGDHKVNGPYQVEAIWVAQGDQEVSKMALREEMAAFQTYSYTSEPYQANDFIVRAALVAGTYSYAGTDTDANGMLDLITISVPLNIAIPGAFTVEADLYDGQGRFVGRAKWTGSDSSASLEYAVAGTVPPYSLEHLNLLDAQGKNLSSFYAPVYTIDDLTGRIDQGNVVLESSLSDLSLPSAIVPTNVFAATLNDLNANGRADQLAVSAALNVTDQGGSYWIEGLLLDDRNMPVAWSVSDPQTLVVGQNQTIQMTFDGRMLFDQLPLAGSQKFTLVAVKIFSGTPGQATLEANIPVTGFATPVYSRTQFDPSSSASPLFEDDIEAGTTKWDITTSSQWSWSNNIWHSWTHAWVANGSTTKSGLLSLATPLDLTDYANVWLRFSTAYELSGTDSVRLEVSTNGTVWTVIKTYTGATAYWTPEMIDLSAYGNTADVRIRFNAQSYTNSIWYIDDVYVYAGVNTFALYLPLIRR